MKPETPAERGAKGGRGKKAPVPDTGALASRTASTYRKVAAHQSKIGDYYQQAGKGKAEGRPRPKIDTSHTEGMQMVGSLRIPTAGKRHVIARLEDDLTWTCKDKAIERRLNLHFPKNPNHHGPTQGPHGLPELKAAAKEYGVKPHIARKTPNPPGVDY
jgi:hypothetical protein